MQNFALKFLLIILLTFSSAGAYFTLVGSRTFIFGGEYKVFVTSSYGQVKPAKVLKLELIGSELGEVLYEDVPLDASETMVTFDMTRHSRFENFTLHAKLQDTDYHQSVKITTVNKNHSEIIQTDKALYKPGDKIQFRVIVLDADGKPYLFDEKLLDANITDSHGNNVFESKTEKVTKIFAGVFAGEYGISDSPPLGTWRISVRIGKGLFSFRNFEVAEYVLPRFSANIEAPLAVLLKDGKIKVVVFGEYTFGEFVSAEATVTAKAYNKNSTETLKTKTLKIPNVTAKKTLEFNLTKDLNMKFAGKIEVEVEIEEKSTRKKAKKSRIVTVYDNESHTIELVKSQNKFRPGFPFTLKALVRRYDGTIEMSKREKIKLSGTIHYQRPKSAEPLKNKKSPLKNSVIPQQQQILRNGSAEFTIDVPQDAVRILFTITYLNSEENLNVTYLKSRSREYLSCQLVTETPPVEGSILVRVNSTKELKYAYYVVTGRKLHHARISQSRNRISFEFPMKVTSNMTPTSKVIVYYIHESGEVIYDSIDIPTDYRLENNLSISTMRETSPGLESRITLKSSPNSFVGLLAVDKRVLLSKASNDIDRSRVFAELSSFDPSWKYEPLTIGGWESSYFDFGGTNTFLLSDAERDDELSTRFFDSDESMIDIDDFDYSGFTKDSEETKSAAKDSEKVRKNFPETWLFENLQLDENGQYELRRTVPDSITSYVITGFSLDEEYGLGLAEPETLYVKQKFFMKINLPFSIRWGEILRVEVQVFNYVPDRKLNLGVDVHMFRDPDDPPFEFLEKTSKCKFETKEGIDNSSKIISVAQHSMATTYFHIKPLKSGKIKMNFKAKAQQLELNDWVEKEILVEFDGITTFVNHPVMIDLTKGDFHSYLYQIETPEDAIPKSIKVGASLIGDMMGAALKNVDSLINLPVGCAEQRLVTFVASLVATNYLKSIDQFTKEDSKKSENSLRTGYHQIIERKNSDGSFNLWGYEKSDSIWLSAYMLKCLGLVKYQTKINDIHIHDAMKFLISRQDSEGSFAEYGPISHKRIQGGLTGEISLTAYVAVSFLEIPEYQSRYKSSMEKALDYLDQNVMELESSHALAITAYAMVLGKHPNAHQYVRELVSKSRKKEDATFWDVELGGTNKKEDFSDIPVQIETAAYALLAFLKMGNLTEAVPVINWLISKRNADGGFYSTQDTVIGLQALAEAAKIFYHPNVRMNVKIGHTFNTFDKNVTSENRFDVQHFEFQQNWRHFSVNANGKGKALLNIWHSYNTAEALPSDAFELNLKVLAAKNGGVFYLKACTKRQILEDDSRRMVVMEISLPSGYAYDSDSTPSLNEAGVKKVETRDQKSQVILYFDEISEEQTCPEIRAIREFNVEQLKNSPVKIYDYYEPGKMTVEYYSTAGAQSCQ